MMAPLATVEAFTADYDLQLPILMAPMAGASPPALAIAVANAGGMGACGTLLLPPDGIAGWAGEVRAATNGGFQLNQWIPDPAPVRDEAAEAAVRDALAAWGPPVPASAADVPLQDFDAQCRAMLDAGPTVISSIMGLYEPAFIAEMKARGIRWWANVTTVGEAEAAEAAGADAIVAQGAEAGGHRGAFEAAGAEARAVGLFSLLPQVVDAVSLPVIATGGIADARGIAAALVLGASAAQIGTGLLRTPEAALAPAWADGLARARPEDTMLTRAFSGRTGRALATDYTRAWAGPDTPEPAPYPIQRALTQAMRNEGTKADDLARIQAWSGQSAGLAQARPTGDLVAELWAEARALLA